RFSRDWSSDVCSSDLSLRRTPWVNLTDGLLIGTTRLPLTPAQILDQDVLILSDVSATALDWNQWDAVHRLINERGGSLILIAGEIGRASCRVSVKSRI